MPKGIYKHKPLAQETKNKLSKIGKEKGFGKWNLGRHPTEESRKKMGLSQKGKRLNVNNPNWKGVFSSNRKIWQREYYYRYPTKKLSNQLRQSIKRAMDNLTIQDIQIIYNDNIKKYGVLTCYLCLKCIPFSQDSLEHKIPISRGGTNKYDNLGVAHKICNSKKHNKTEEEYRRYCYGTN